MNQQPIIQIQNLSKTFAEKGQIVEALKDINLEIYRGEIIGIIGLSGAGKSTLVRCINYLERPTKGRVLFHQDETSYDLSTLTAKELNQVRKKITMIFQQFNLLMQRTALENVCLPMELNQVEKKTAINRAKELLEMVGLSDRMNNYPNQLSGGQKQRVAIARALATNPDILLCDEATSALDPNTTHAVLGLLKEINQKLGVTVIIITHEMSVVEEVCDRVAIIDQSQIAEVATVAELFGNPMTEIGKHLIYPHAKLKNKEFSDKALRVVFNGVASSEPIISNMVLECHCPVNIMFADTRNVEGKAMGQMIIQLPKEATTADKMRRFLSTQNVVVEEVELDV